MKCNLPFVDRIQAGSLLGTMIPEALDPPGDALILGLVRGGAMVAAQAARASGLAWDILIVRKIGAPHHKEYAIGAYAESGAYMLNEDALQRMGLSQGWRETALKEAARQCADLHNDLRGGAPAPELAGRFVILIDDGMATGMSMLVAILAAKRAQASEVCVAVPVLAPDGPALLREAGVQHAYLAMPGDFHAVGQYYRDFHAVSSGEVRELLAAR